MAVTDYEPYKCFDLILYPQLQLPPHGQVQCSEVLVATEGLIAKYEAGQHVK